MAPELAEHTGDLSSFAHANGQYITVVRDPGGPANRVTLDQVLHTELRTRTGGRPSPLPAPEVGVTVLCTDVPGIPHYGTHGGPCPHAIVVLVPEDQNEPAIYEPLRAAAEENRRARRRSERHRRVERRRQERTARRAARAAAAATPASIV